MTTIIAKRNPNGTVDLGWDSQSTGGGTAHSEKVTHKNDQIYIGVAGRTRYGNILQYTDVPAIHPADYAEEGFDFPGYLITKLVPAWVENLEKQFKKIPDQQEDWPWGVALIVIGGRIFQVHHDFTVTESDKDYDGIGSGSEYAMGALASGKSVEKALEIAAELDVYTGGKLNVVKGIK